MLKKVQGSQEYYLQIIYNLDKPANQFITKEIGPILYALLFAGGESLVPSLRFLTINSLV